MVPSRYAVPIKLTLYLLQAYALHCHRAAFPWTLLAEFALLHTFSNLFPSFIVCLLVLWLLGASFWERSTALAACLLALRTTRLIHRILRKPLLTPKDSLPGFLPEWLAVIGAVCGAWCLPLDWNAPWQAWPTPVLYGCLLATLPASLLTFPAK